jgi:hypothetical protein
VWVENCSDEVWIGVKGQSNWEIAGSPRNIFRYSLAEFSVVVEHSLNFWGRKLTKFLLTPNAIVFEGGKQTVGDKLHSREGNSPDHQLRSLNIC